MKPLPIAALVLVLFAGALPRALGQPSEISPESRAEAARLLEEGRKLIGDGRLLDAAALFRRAWNLDPFDVMAPFHLAEVEYALGRRGADPGWVERAREFLVQGERVNPEFGGLPFLLATIGREVGDFETGIRGFSAAIERGYRLLDSRIGLAECLLRRGVQLSQDVAVDPEAAVQLLTDARDRLAVLMEDSRFDGPALERFRAEWIESRNFLAVAHHRAGRSETAQKLLVDLAELEPENPAHPLSLGQLLASEERWEEALRACERALEVSKDPDWLEPLPVIAEIRSRRGEGDAAEKLFHAYLKKNPGDPVALFGLGEHLARVGKYVEAIDAIEGCVEADPFRLDLILRLAELHEKAGHEAEAAKWRLLHETLVREDSK